jgi:hypothetical protein
VIVGRHSLETAERRVRAAAVAVLIAEFRGVAPHAVHTSVIEPSRLAAGVANAPGSSERGEG